MAPYAPISRQQPPPQRNDASIFTYFNYGKLGHMAKKCKSRHKPVGSNAQVNLTDEQFIVMTTEINIVCGSDSWWIDISASHHVCYDRAMFKTYTNAEDKKVMLGDAHATNVAGIGNVELNFTSRKTLILKDVMHVLEIRKNLVSGFLLNKAGFSHSIGAYLYTITKNGIFVGKGYATYGMFKLNVELNKISPSIYSLCDFNIWHARLCHVNKRVISNAYNVGLIPKLNVNDSDICEYCSQAKITRTSHK